MGVNVNQYLIYGVKKSCQWEKEWEQQHEKNFYDTFEEFMDGSAFNKKICNKDGIFCLIDGMDGRYMFIGRVLDKGSDEDPMVADNKPRLLVPPDENDIADIRDSIKRNFGLDEELGLWLVTHYS